MKVFVRKSFKENKSYHWYLAYFPTVSQYFGKFSFRNSIIDNRQSSWMISMSTFSQRFRMMLAKIERHVQKCDEMWWNEILSRKFLVIIFVSFSTNLDWKYCFFLEKKVFTLQFIAWVVYDLRFVIYYVMIDLICKL